MVFILTFCKVYKHFFLYIINSVTNMFEINKTNATKIKMGDFPLNHDCVLKVHYAPGYLLRFQLLTCRSQDSGAIVLTLSSLSVVRNIEVSSVDNFGL